MPPLGATVHSSRPRDDLRAFKTCLHLRVLNTDGRNKHTCRSCHPGHNKNRMSNELCDWVHAEKDRRQCPSSRHAVDWALVH